MKKSLSVLFILAMILATGFSFAESKHVCPLELTPESYDLNNGEFWFDADIEANPVGNSIPMTLCLEDRYDPDEIKNLENGDTVEVNGKTYTVDVVVIHGWYDSNGDGELDAGSITVKNPETAQYLLDKYETVITHWDLVPSSYEIYYQEEYDGYVAFDISDDGYCHPVVDDATFLREIGKAEIPLPLPEGFTYHYEIDFKKYDGGAQEFLKDLNEYGFSSYHSLARFENGKLMEVWNFEY